MDSNQTQLLSIDTPISFCDGTKLYKQLSHSYEVHKQGLFIVAPSGSGKSYFIQHQAPSEWIDGDLLWEAALATPTGSWWNLPDIDRIEAIEARCDVITAEARGLGFWILGASNTWLKPDAVVLPKWSTHRRYIRSRELGNYDGGATSHDFQAVLRARRWIRRWKKSGVPQFDSVEAAVASLTVSK